MERIRTSEINYSNHEDKCRICIKPFGADDHHIAITKSVEKRFHDLTQQNLKSSNDYSRRICVVCNFQFKDFCVFKRNVLSTQKNLCEFTDKYMKIEKLESESLEIEEYLENEPGEPEVKTFDQPQSEFLDFNSDLNFERSPYLENQSDYEVQFHQINIGETDTISQCKCTHCDYTTLSRYNLEHHLKEIHAIIKNYACDLCNFKCHLKREVDNHLMTSHIATEEQVEFICKKCDFLSLSQEHLTIHELRVHNQGENFKCTDCGSMFSSYNSYNNHKLKMHSSAKDRTKWICKHCNTSFSGSRSLRDHITVMHSRVKPEIPCPVKSCRKTFTITKRLRAHIKVHDDDSKEMCPECGLLVTSKHNLQKHIKRVHLKLRNFFCDICGYGATFRHSIVAHMISHVDRSERRKWNCDECNFVSVSKQSLRAHKSYEHSGTFYTCHCGKQFNQRASLTTHIKCVHHKIKDHLCNLCGKAYFSRNDLKHHKKSQHMQKDMPCEICGKLFATSKHLTRHRLYHLEPRYKCHVEGCQKAFIDNAKLKDHMKLHDNQRDHLCHLCEKSYFHQKDLKRHLDVAHKATIFYCEICTFTISRKDYLRNHLNSAHKHLTVEEKNEILARTKVTRNVV